MQFTNIRDLKYADAEHTKVDLYATCSMFGEIPMTVNLVDTEDLHTMLLDGEEIPLETYCKTLNIDDFSTPIKTEEQLKAEAKEQIAQQLSTLTVTTSRGNTFDADSKARQDMADVIIASTTLGITKTIWRMADDNEVEIELEELKEAHALAIQAYAKVKLIGA